MIVHGSNDSQQSSASTIETVVEAVGRATDRDPLELPPLWDVIDPEALEALFAPTRAGRPRSGRVEFGYCDHLVTVGVDADGETNVSLEAVDLEARDR